MKGVKMQCLQAARNNCKILLGLWNYDKIGKCWSLSARLSIADEVLRQQPNSDIGNPSICSRDYLS